MRRCYLVCYDIADPKRLQRVFKLMKGYGEHWQFSVFFCVLRDIDHARMQVRIEEEVNAREDQVLIIDLGPNDDAVRKAATIIGRALPRAPKHTTVV